MFAKMIRDFKLFSGTVIPTGSLALVTPFNLTTASVKFQEKTYSVRMTDLHKWFEEFKKVEIEDLETSDFNNGWPVEILA
jgi:hypothetical protein